MGNEDKHVTYFFTINTDASHHNFHKVSAWAYWIRSDHYLVKQSGYLEEPVPNSSVAEILTIEKALKRIHKMIKKEPFLKHHRQNGRIRLVINTDSMWCIQALNGNVKRSRHLKYVRRVKKFTQGFEIDMRHVRSHTGKDDARSWVNDWCDAQAKRLVRKRVKEIQNNGG